MSKANTAAGAAMILIGFVGLIIALMLLNGFMISYLWEWFIVPLGVRSIGIAHAIGIAAIIAMTARNHTDTEDGKGFEKLFASVGAKLVAFGIAYIVASFM